MKKQATLAILMILTVLVNESISQDLSFECYRHIVFRESPYASLKGIYPISAVEAEQSVHFRFYYNERQLVKRVEYRDGTVLRNIEELQDRYFFAAPVIEYTYEDGQIVRTFRNEFDKPINIGRVHKEVISVDENDKPINLTYYDSNGNPATNGWAIHEYQWETKDGYVVERRFDQKGELISMRPNLSFYEIHLYYDKDGFLTKMSNYGKNGQLTENETGVAHDVIYYDDNGNFIEWNVLDKAGNLISGNAPGVAIGRSLYDRQGNQLRLEFFDEQKVRQLSNDNIAISEFSYDDRGRITRNYFRDTYGMLLKDTVSIIELDYNERGNRKRISFFDDSRQAINNAAFGTIATLEYSYGTSGEQTKIAFFDKNGEPTNSPMANGAAIIEYSYDENFNKSGVKLIDKDGKILN